MNSNDEENKVYYFKYIKVLGIKGRLYECNFNIKIDENIFEYLLVGIENPSDFKSNVRIKQIFKNGEKIGKELFKEAYAYVTETIFYLNYKFKEKMKFINENDYYYDQNFIEIKLPKNNSINIIKNYNNILTKNFLYTLYDKSPKKLNEIFNTSFLIKLQQFSKDWNNLMALDQVKENEFQKLLEKNKEFFPIIFGIYNVNNVIIEKTITEEKTNRIDLFANGLIVELKKPSTKIFLNSGGRNNIAPLSKDLINAVTQLELYILRKKQEINFKSKSFFIKGILLIGRKSQFQEFNDKYQEYEYYLSWNIFRSNFKVEILTFDDISDKLNSFLKNF